jgi:ABC-type lipoprotein release transport system permease subunit
MMARLGLLLPLAWRNLWRNPRRTIITLLVVTVGVWSILAFAVLLKAWSQSSRDTTQKMLTGQGQIHAASYLNDPVAAHSMSAPGGALLKILRSSAIAHYANRVRVNAIVQSEYKTLPATLVGVSPSQESAISVIPKQITAGRYLDGPADGGIVLGRNMAERLNTRIGKRVVVMAQAVDGHLAERAFRVTGLFAAPEQIEDEFMFTGIGTAQAFTELGSNLSEIAVVTPSEEDIPAAMEALRRAAPKLDIQSWKTLEPLPYAVSTFFNEFILIWLWLIFALMAIGIMNTQLMAVFERTREFGLLQALGMRPRLVLLQVTLESALLIGVGTLAGIVAAVLTVQAFPDGLDLGFLGRGAELVGAGRILYPRVDVGDFILYSAIIWALGVVASLWPARRASRISPVEAMSRAID